MPVILRFVKVATPPTALTVVVPESAPVPEAIAAVTAFVAAPIARPAASRNEITGCVVKLIPLTAPLGCVVITRVRTTCVTVTVPDVADVSAAAVNTMV